MCVPTYYALYVCMYATLPRKWFHFFICRHVGKNHNHFQLWENVFRHWMAGNQMNLVVIWKSVSELYVGWLDGGT